MSTILRCIAGVLVILGLASLGAGCDSQTPTPVPEDPFTLDPESGGEQTEAPEDPLDGIGKMELDPMTPPGASTRR